MAAKGDSKSSTGRKTVAPLKDAAFSSTQLNLFQGLLANTDGERDVLSNAVDLWDSVPRYSISRAQMNKLRTADGHLNVAELAFNYRQKPLVARIYPAQIKHGYDDKGRPLYKSFYPSAREELVEHALRKIAAEQGSGFFDQETYRSGARFSLHQLRSELERQGHSLRYDEVIEALDVLSLSAIEIEGTTEDGEAAFARSTYFSALSGVRRKQYDKDHGSKWIVQFHPLVTQSIALVTYRQFNYQRLMQCRNQLSRWLIGQLVLKYTQAAQHLTFEMRYKTIKRDSALLNGYRLERQAIAHLDTSWGELKELRALAEVKKVEQRGPHGKLLDVVYTVTPTLEFAREQKAANKRKGGSDSLEKPILHKR